VVGAAATLTEIQEFIAADLPALGSMLRWFGSRQVRNRATMGGNLVTASPIGDCAPVLLALDAHVVLASVRRERRLPLREFFTAYRRTALQAGELLKSILLPRGPSRRGLRRLSRFYKVSKRREMDISTVAVCFTVDLDRDGVVRHARIGCGGVAATPARAIQTEEALLGRPWSAATIASVRPLLRSEFTPLSDLRGSAEFRADVLASLLEKFFDETRPDAPAETGPEPMDSPAPPEASPHESARGHVTGEAIYTDDEAAGLLEVWPVGAGPARGKIRKRSVDAARRMPGVIAVLLAEDIPGMNDVGAVRHDEVLLAKDEVLFHGQPIALVVGESPAVCRAAAARTDLRVEPQPPILTLRDAIAAKSFHTEPAFIRRGDAAEALVRAPLSLRGEFECGGQEHFYLETQAGWAKPGEDGTMFVASSTQHPSEVQHVVARVLGVPGNKVVVQSLRMGGGFGGKETQAAMPAALAALAAWKTGRAVRVRWNRDQDMMLTGKRHPFYARFEVGFDAEGRLLAARVELFSNGGWSLDLSQAVTDRAMFHLDNAYYIPAVEFSGRVCRTHLASNTAFRGFGGPQGMLVMEEILDRVARRTGVSPETVRERNLYRGTGETNTTPYGQEIADERIQRVWHELKAGSEFAVRRAQLRAWNAAHVHRKRGLAITPVKFGISFTVTHLNQAGALVLWFQDGSVQVNHGGTEMGQGIHTNIRAIAARALGVAPDKVRVMPTSTDKVPNTSATAASCGTDLNGAAVLDACETLRARVAPAAVRLLTRDAAGPVTPEQLVFADHVVFDRRDPARRVPLAEVLQRAYLDRVSLAATGYYRTPGIHYDRAAGRGRPFHYFAVGAAVAEVEVDGCTGMMQVRRVDILHDAGEGINAGVNRGQVEGGFVQGMGWLTGEELVWDAQGRLLTHSPDTYKIPACNDAPRDFRVAFLTDAAQPGVVQGSKAVGEPPLMLAISVREAIRDAVAAFASGDGEIALPSPATTEAIYRAVSRRCAAVASARGTDAPGVDGSRKSEARNPKSEGNPKARRPKERAATRPA
jgi:xanthine dehydrogenase molybdopterin binding subunit